MHHASDPYAVQCTLDVAVECFRSEKFLKTVKTPVTKRYSSSYLFSNVIVTADLRLKVYKVVDRFEAFSIHFQNMIQQSAIRQSSCHVLGFLLTDLETEFFAFFQIRISFVKRNYLR